jgi:hypothetical protein
MVGALKNIFFPIFSSRHNGHHMYPSSSIHHNTDADAEAAITSSSIHSFIHIPSPFVTKEKKRVENTRAVYRPLA